VACAIQKYISAKTNSVDQYVLPSIEFKDFDHKRMARISAKFA